MFVIDLLVVTVAILVGYLVRFQGAPTGTNVPYLLVGIGLGVAVDAVPATDRAATTSASSATAPDEYRRVVGGSLKLAGAVAIVAYLAEVEVSRGFLGIAFLIGTAAAAGRPLRRPPRRCTAPAPATRAGRGGCSWSATPRTCIELVAPAAPGVVRRLPGGRRLHPRRADRPGAAAPRRRAGGRLVPQHPRGGRRGLAPTPSRSPARPS